MNNYHASFSIKGEVTQMLIVQKPVRRLLVDISAHPEVDQDISDFLYRTSFSVLDPLIIAELQDQVSTGDVIEAKGSFWQTGYVPHQQGYIDTTFCLTSFQLIEKRMDSSMRHNPYQSLLSHIFVH
ncbi:MAG: hypothetical protein COC12_06455 [Rhodobacteraceae bacterium]|nr:MAG: hypothetical protein COC12_06455 [Paracoccaceae bacterium]